MRLTKPDRDIVAQNLTRVMDAKGIGVRELARLVDAAVKASGAVSPGNVSYGTIRAYTLGTATPRAEPLRWIAGALGVRAEWLIWNEGQPTDEGERLMVAGDTDERRRIDAVFPEFSLLPDDAQLLVLAALARSTHPDGEGGLLHALRLFIMGPLQWRASAMGGVVVNRSDPAHQDYLRAALGAFILAIPQR
jgi:transcriptional regulator with XRE-family HTH domain